MRTPLALLPLLALACSASPIAPAPSSPTESVRGIYTEDLDRSVPPCDDFYDFANGTWRAHNPIPPSMDRWSRRWKAGEENKERLTAILAELAQRSDWPRGSVEQQSGDFYASCMDEAAVEAAGKTPIAGRLAAIASMGDVKGLGAVLRQLQRERVMVPFFVIHAADVHDPDRTIAEVYAGGLGLPDRDYYFKPEPRFVEARERYKLYATRMFMLLGESEAAARAAADVVFAFETRLANATLDNVARRDPHATDHLMPFTALKALTPSFDWEVFFGEGHIAQSDVNVAEPAFLAQFEKELAGTPLPAWKAYLALRVLDDAAPWLSKPFVDEWFDFQRRYLLGVGEMKPRSTRCAELADELLGEAVGQKYVERYFPPAAKAKAAALVQNELAAMKTILEGLTWMGPNTRAKALEKLASFRFKVGYPDRWLDYSKVTIQRESLHDNIVAAASFVVADSWSQIGKPTDRERWGMTPPQSNAYCNFTLNEIVFPAGILQPPAFDVNASDAVNYGAIGYVIGHEISHAFDDQGAKFDARGRLANWWTPADEEAFRARGACVAEQFEGYFVEPGIHHNGQLVLGESIGDLAGVRVAFTAFQAVNAAHPQPATNGFTPEQEFFIALGQFRGDATRPETMRNMVQGDPHPVAKFRVLGPLSNFTPFQEAFRCQEGAKMVRPSAQRCQVW